MEGLKNKKYMHVTRKKFDPFALFVAGIGLVGVFMTLGSFEESRYLLDVRSIIVVVGGTIASLFFQYDFSAIINCSYLILKSLLGTPERPLMQVLSELDEAIVNDDALEDLREGYEITGELLNDVVFMKKSGLLLEEIDEFVTSRISDEYLNRNIAVTLLNKAAVVAPALGLFGTVVGLMGVLRSLKDPSEIGPSMSLALMTTAYGAGIGSLIFSPMAGRLEHHNTIFLEVHQRLMSKIGVLIHRDDRNMAETTDPGEVA